MHQCVSACMCMHAYTCVPCIHMRACACVRARVCECTFPNVCARGRAHVCACTCVRARCAGAKSRLWPSYSPASFGRPAQIPRAGKPRRSRNPHTEPILLRATTGGAAGESAAMACLPRIVELARVRLGVGSGVEAPSFERRRMLPNRATLCCVHTPTRAHTPAAIRPKRPSLRWADLRDGDRSDLLLQVLDRRTWDR